MSNADPNSNMDTSTNAVDALVGQVVEQQALLAAQQRQQAARRDQERQDRAKAAKADADRAAAARPAPSAEAAPSGNDNSAHTGLSPSIAGLGFAFAPPAEVAKGANLHQASRRTGMYLYPTI